MKYKIFSKTMQKKYWKHKKERHHTKLLNKCRTEKYFKKIAKRKKVKYKDILTAVEGNEKLRVENFNNNYSADNGNNLWHNFFFMRRL